MLENLILIGSSFGFGFYLTRFFIKKDYKYKYVDLMSAIMFLGAAAIILAKN